MEGITAKPFSNNMRYFNATIAGPKDSPYEGGIFHLELFLPGGYPMEPPKIRFMTKIYHPNIDRLGRICLDVIKDKDWSPALTISSTLISIQSLLSAPNPDDPLNNEAAAKWLSNETEALKQAKDWTKRFAK